MSSMAAGLGHRMTHAIQLLRASAPGILRSVHRLVGIVQRQFGPECRQSGCFPGRSVRSPAGGRALEQAADKHAERDTARYGGNRMLLGESDELVLRFNCGLAGAVDNGRAVEIGVASLTFFHFLLEIGAAGVGHRVNSWMDQSSAERPVQALGSSSCSSRPRKAASPSSIGPRANQITIAAMPAATLLLFSSA